MSSRLASLVRWSARVFGDDVASRVFAPLVADWQRELEKAETPLLLWALLCRGALASVVACVVVGAHIAASSLRSMRRPSAVFYGFTVACAAVLILTAFVPGAVRGAYPWHMAWLMLPAATVTATTLALVPFGMSVAGHTDAQARARARIGAAVATAGLSLVLFTLSGWAVPLAGRRWAVMESARTATPVRPVSVRDSTVSALWQQSRSESSADATRELRRRLAVPVLWPAALTFLGWRLGRRLGPVDKAGLFGGWLAGAASVLAVALVYVRGGTPLEPTLLCFMVWIAGGWACRPRTSIGGVYDARS